MIPLPCPKCGGAPEVWEDWCYCYECWDGDPEAESPLYGSSWGSPKAAIENWNEAVEDWLAEFGPEEVAQ